MNNRAILASFALVCALGAGCTGKLKFTPSDELRLKKQGCLGVNDNLASMALIRLSREEYEYTVQDLLGLTASYAKDFPVDVKYFGFSNVATQLTVPQALIDQAVSVAEQIATEMAITRSATGTGLYVSCATTTSTTLRSCALSALQPFAARAFRRPVDATELAPLVDLVHSTVTNGDTFEMASGRP